MKLIVTDLDGTLLSDEKKVSEYNIEILNRAVKEKEIELVVASGRDIYSIKNLTKDLKIKYYICFNGAKIYNDDKLIYKEAIDELEYNKSKFAEKQKEETQKSKGKTTITVVQREV